MSVTTPNYAGFIAADKRFRKLFGDTIRFSVPVVPQWPPGTTINPDTGLPYSAMVVRTNPEYTTLNVICLVIIKQASPLRPQADTEWSEMGLMSGMDIILDVGGDDYPSIEAATEFRYVTKNYRAEEAKPFTIGDTLYRWLIYGKER